MRRNFNSIRFTKDSCRCTKDSCELCRTINAEPLNMEKHGAKLVTARVKINNVCLGKKVAVACVVYDEYNKILAFKGFITTASRNVSGGDDACGTIERSIVFVIPEDYSCDLDKLRIRTKANYIYPCE